MAMATAGDLSFSMVMVAAGGMVMVAVSTGTIYSSMAMVAAGARAASSSMVAPWATVRTPLGSYGEYDEVNGFSG